MFHFIKRSLVFIKVVLSGYFVLYCCPQNTASPWLPQSAGSTADGLGLLSHAPMRPASADAYRAAVKIDTHTSASLSNASVDIPKE